MSAMNETPAQPNPGFPGGGAGPDPSTPPVAPPPAAPRSGADAFFDSIRRTGLFRSDERWVGGVAGGIAARLGIDPLVVRGLFGVATLLGGVGLVLYGIGWLLLPEQRDGRIHLQQLFRGDFDAAVIGGFAAILIGIGVPDGVFMPWWNGNSGWWRGIAGIALLVVVVAVIASLAGRSRGTGPTTSLPRTPPYGQPGPMPPYGGPTPPPYGGPTPPPPYGGPTPGAPTPGATAAGPQPAHGGPTPAVAYHHPEGTSMTTAPPAAPAPQGYGPGPHGPAYVPPRPPVPPVPPGPATSLPATSRPAGPGVRPVGLVVALSLLTWAGLLYAERIGRFDAPVLLTAAAVMVVLAGLGVAISGALGRRSGGLGALAVLTLVVIVPIAVTSSHTWRTGAFIGNVRYQPTEVSVAEEGYSVFAGEVVLDLTELPASDDVVEVPVHLGAGELRIIVPDDGAYTARVRQPAGEFTWPGEPTVTGVTDGGWRTYESPAVADGAEPEIALEITIGAGNLTVEED